MTAVFYSMDTCLWRQCVASDATCGKTEKCSLRGRRNVILPGQYYDIETGLHYNWHRDYDPTFGRYIQSDPIGLAGGINTYAYVENNPINSFDPDGQNAWVLRGSWAFGRRTVGRGVNALLTRALIAGTGTTLGGLIYEACHEDYDPNEGPDCQEWLDVLNASYALLSISAPSPAQKIQEKKEHDESVDIFCSVCPDFCASARRFGKVPLQ